MVRDVERDQRRRPDAVRPRQDVEAVRPGRATASHAVDPGRRAALQRDVDERRLAGQWRRSGTARSLLEQSGHRRRSSRGSRHRRRHRQHRQRRDRARAPLSPSAAPPLPPRSPWATARACSMPAIDTSVCAMSGRASVSVVAAGSSRNRPTFRPRDQVVAGELVADVDDVRAHRAGRERAVADLLEPFLPLPEVDGDGDDLGAVGVGEPRDGDRACRARRRAPAPCARPSGLSGSVIRRRNPSAA